MKHSMIFLYVLFFASLAFAESDKELLVQANKLYTTKNYDDAIKIYMTLYQHGYNNFNINYNLGCAYYQLGRLGLARYYLETAFIHAPFNKDVATNLHFVYNKIYPDEPYEDDLVVKKWLLVFHPYLLSFCFFVCIIGGIAAFAGYIFLQRKKALMILGALLLLFSFFVAFISVVQYSVVNEKSAIVIAKEADVYLSPDSDTVITSVRSGEKVPFSDQIGGFLMIKLSDSTTGWIKSDYVKIIK